MEARNKGDYAKELVLAKRFRDAYSQSDIAWICVGDSYWKLRKMNEAIEALRKATELNSNKATTWGWAWTRSVDTE